MPLELLLFFFSLWHGFGYLLQNEGDPALRATPKVCDLQKQLEIFRFLVWLNLMRLTLKFHFSQKYILK